MKKIFTYFLILLILLVNISITQAEEEKKSSYSFESEYKLYEERVRDICDKYQYKNQDKKKGKIKFLINIKDNYPKIISKEEMQKLKGPIEENIKKQEEKIQQEREKLEEIKNKEVPEDWTKTESWVRDPNLSDKENQDSYNEYKTRQSNRNNEYSIQEDKLNEEQSKFYSEKQKITNIENENTVSYSLPEVKNAHKTNMNNIYKCALLNVQKKSLLLIKKDLINKSPGVGKTIGYTIDIKVNRIKQSISSLGCVDSKEKSSIQKLNVLAQATYQTCKYVSYLEYLKEYNKKIDNILPDNRTQFTIGEVPKIREIKLNELDKEIEHSYKIFPLAFHAYTEYENNITIHFLLELLREDYIVLREKIHKALNPINQVVYKIANAMKK